MIKIYYSDELYHHGTAGQKWGVRHGPPYPLSRLKNSIGARARRRAAARKAAASRVANDTVPQNDTKAEVHKSSSKRRQEETQTARAKNDVLTRGSARQVLQYHRQNPFTNTELKDAIERIKFENELSSLDRQSQTTLLDRLTRFQSYTDVTSKLIANVSSIIGSSETIAKRLGNKSSDTSTSTNNTSTETSTNTTKPKNEASRTSSSTSSNTGSGNGVRGQQWNVNNGFDFNAAAWDTVDMMNRASQQRRLPG